MSCWECAENASGMGGGTRRKTRRNRRRCQPAYHAPVRQHDSGQQRARAAVFGLTWVAYASYYLARKNFSVVKARLSTDLGLTKTQLGDIDTGYLAAYCAGQ